MPLHHVNTSSNTKPLHTAQSYEYGGKERKENLRVYVLKIYVSKDWLRWAVDVGMRCGIDGMADHC